MATINKIKLPSNTIYDIRDADAQTRIGTAEGNITTIQGDISTIQTDISNLQNAVAGGVSFIVAWDGTAAPTASKIPAGVTVTYNNTPTTGTLTVGDAAPGAFYLVKSATLPSGEPVDAYDEYVVVKPSTAESTWYWEKIGDTQVDLSDVVMDASLDKKTDKVIGTDATFTITQPTITLASNTSTATGRVQVVTGASATTTNVQATASGANTAWNAKDQVAAVTGYASPTSDTFLKSIKSTTQKLVTTSITGVSGSTTASKATAATNQTTAKGTGTASTTNTDWLKGVSVSDETLVIGAATIDTQTTTQFTFADVTVPKAASATTVATGKTATSDTNGADVVIATSGDASADALTALGTPSTKNAIGVDSTFTITQPTVALATDATAGTGTVAVATGITPITTYLGATASGANTAWNAKDEVTVLIDTTEVKVTKGQ